MVALVGGSVDPRSIMRAVIRGREAVVARW